MSMSASELNDQVAGGVHAGQIARADHDAAALLLDNRRAGQLASRGKVAAAVDGRHTHLPVYMDAPGAVGGGSGGRIPEPEPAAPAGARPPLNPDVVDHDRLVGLVEVPEATVRLLEGCADGCET